MKLTYESFTTLYPILLGRHRSSFGGSNMHQLRLKAAELEQETDSLPFPCAVSRIGSWQPKPLWAPHEAEEALARVQANLDRLGLFLTPADPDRPRAA